MSACYDYNVSDLTAAHVYSNIKNWAKQQQFAKQNHNNHR